MGREVRGVGSMYLEMAQAGEGGTQGERVDGSALELALHLWTPVPEALSAIH